MGEPAGGRCGGRRRDDPRGRRGVAAEWRSRRSRDDPVLERVPCACSPWAPSSRCCSRSCRYETLARGAAPTAARRCRGGAAPPRRSPVTFGPAMGSVDWYAGTHKGPLSWDDCIEVSAVVDEAREWVEQWPTAADAEADGWAQVTRFFGGMGTHHIRGGITPGDAHRPGLRPPRPDARRRRARRRVRPRSARRPAVRRRRPGREAGRLQLLRAHVHRGAPRGPPRDQRLVAPPPVDLPSPQRRRPGRLQHQRRQLRRRRRHQRRHVRPTTCSTCGCWRRWCSPRTCSPG